MTNNQLKMVNPLRILPVIINILPLPMLMWLGFDIWSDAPFSMAISIMMFAISGLLLIVSFYPGVIHYPTFVILRNEGLTFEFRWSKPREVDWNLIEYVHTHETQDAGGICIRGEFVKYYINREIAKVVRDKYASIIGKYPLTGEEYDIRKSALRRSSNYLRHKLEAVADDNPSWNGEILEIPGTKLSFPRNVPSSFLVAISLYISLSVLAIYITYASILVLASVSIFVVFGFFYIYVYVLLSNQAKRDSSSIWLEKDKVIFSNSSLDHMKDMPDSLRYDDIDHVHIHLRPLSDAREPSLIIFIDKKWKAIDGGIKNSSGLLEAKQFLESKGVNVEEHLYA